MLELGWWTMTLEEPTIPALTKRRLMFIFVALMLGM